jgi:hypothetical protein
MPSLIVVLSTLLESKMFNLMQTTVNPNCTYITSLKFLILYTMKETITHIKKFLFNYMQSLKMVVKLPMAVP